MSVVISGIQQIGVGIPDVYEAWAWYRKYFGMDVPIFDEAAQAALMLPYTGGKPQDRHAVLALNMQGGGGMEIWQYKSRVPQAPNFEPQLGDLGIFIGKIKSREVATAYEKMKAEGLTILGELQKDPQGEDHFFVKDPYGNIFQVGEGRGWFATGKHITGGPSGCVIGVTDINRALPFYGNILGYDRVLYDETGVFEDFSVLPAGEGNFRRVLLTHSEQRKGSFSPLLGPSVLELVEAKDRSPQKLFEGRFWGDLGFIHLCFDIKGMDELRKQCAEAGHPFTVDSGDFDMGEAAGQFAYIEDPDGTLIEFVETHKIPIAKKIGWYLDLRKRDPEKSLPRWMLKAMGLNRVKD